MSSKADRLIAAATDIAGGAISGALGFLASNPADAAAAGAAGALFARGVTGILSDLANRQLSGREQARVGAAAAFALVRIDDRLRSGDSPRDMTFFTPTDTSRSSADEILEGVLLLAKKEHQEKKLRLLGNFFGNLAFAPSISVGEANHLLRLAESMTYRQMLILAILDRKRQIQSIPLREEDYSDPNDEFPTELISLVQEIYDLTDLGLVWRQVDERRTGAPVMNWRFVTPREMSLTPLGRNLAALLDAASIPASELEEVAALLTR